MTSPKSPNSHPKLSLLEAQLNPNHPLVQLAKSIDWSALEEQFSQPLSASGGRPALPTQLVVGLHYLKSLYNESDESVVSKWVENPYWQFFCGEREFQHNFPCHPTSLGKWRKQVGADGMEALLKQVIQWEAWRSMAILTMGKHLRLHWSKRKDSLRWVPSKLPLIKDFEADITIQAFSPS